MRLLDEEADRSLAKLALYLTPKEAADVQSALDALIADFDAGRHEHRHISDKQYAHHLTLVVYEPGETEGFQTRYRQLIEEDQ